MAFSALIAGAVTGAAKAAGDGCMYPDCIFSKSTGGGCMFETCLILEFPKHSGGKKIECMICGEEESYTAGEMHFRTCKKCAEKILHAGKERTECVFCGKGVTPTEEKIFCSGICDDCMDVLNSALTEDKVKCPACGKKSVINEGNLANFCEECTSYFNAVLKDEPKCPFCGKAGKKRIGSFDVTCDDCMDKIRTISTITYTG